MDATTLGPEPRRFEDLVVTCRAFAAGYLAFRKLDEDTREDVDELVSAAVRDDMESHEREGIFATLAQILFPALCHSLDRSTFEVSNEVHTREGVLSAQSLDQEEATFASLLQEALGAKAFTQTALAQAIGVHQSAISMMLSRKCRPQRRTVERIAAALGVDPSSLWPSFKGEITQNTGGTSLKTSLCQGDLVNRTFVADPPPQDDSCNWGDELSYASAESLDSPDRPREAA